MRNALRIKELEEQLRGARLLARTKREPSVGIGASIQIYRERKGIGLTQLAQLSGLSKGLICRTEQCGHANIELHTLMAICRAFDMTPSAFLRWHEEGQKENAYPVDGSRSKR